MSLNQNTKGVEFLKRLGIKDTREFGTVYRAWINKVVETREPDEKYIGYKIYGQEGHVVLIFGGTDKTGGEGTMLTFEMEGDAHDYETFGDGLKPIIESGIYYGKGGGVKQNEPSMPDAPIDPTFDADADLPAPDEENLVIVEQRNGYTVSYGGKVLKSLKDYDAAVEYANDWQKENNFYPSVYYMNERGNYWLIDKDGNEIKKFEEGGSVGELTEQNPQTQTPYVPKSASCTSLQTITPENMAYDIHKAVAKIDGLVGGVDNYVAEKLGYTVGKCSAAEREAGKECLCNAFSGEQIDAIALAIYNIETKGQGVIIGDQAGIGKGRSQPLTAKLLTPKGWKLMGDIKIDDEVISQDGQATNVVGIYPQGELDVYEILFSDGSKTECSADHLWNAITNNGKYHSTKNPESIFSQYKTKTTRELIDTIHLRYSIPLVEPVHFEEKPVFTDPYLMGYILGNGCIKPGAHGLEIVIPDAETVEYISEALPKGMQAKKKPSRDYHYCIVKESGRFGTEENGQENPVLTSLRNYQLDNVSALTKFIPERYKINSYHVRLSTLRGLMDSDGYVDKSGNLQYYTISNTLADDVAFIVQSLGGIVRRHIKKAPKYTYKGEMRIGKPCHVLTLILPNGINPFRLSRKAQRLRVRTKYSPQRIIRSITHIGKKMCQCIKVAHPSSLYVTDDFIVTHNTAAGMIRYAINKGVMPIFLTIKPTLFSDIYRDLIDIDGDEGIPLRIFTGNKTVERKTIKTEEEIEEADDADVALQEEETEYVEVPTYKTNTEYPKYTYTAKDENGNERKVTKTGNKRIVPFIVNGGGAKTKIKDMDGNILYEGSNEEVKKVIGSLTKRGTYNIPKEYNVILATYSQFGRISAKMNFIEKYAKGAIVIMDESHQASGSSATGEFLCNAIKESLGTVFLSATFAKRPDNMPVYASKTALQDTSLDDDGLIGAINSGGVALQEVISSQLSGEAQMVRRERSYEGIEVNYMYLDESQAKRGYPEMNKEMEHRIIFDSTTDIIRKIIKFQDEYVNERIEFLDKELAGEMKEAGQAAQQIKAGIDNVPSFSGIFNIINQLLFSLKADSVAEHAIQRIKEGKQVLIAFGSTMESFLNNLVVDGKNAEVGDTIKADFSLILERRLDSVLRYRIKDQNGNITRMKMELDELSIGAQMEYKAIMNDINKLALGIKLSPIDVLIEKITAAGFKVKEVTGRNKRLSYIDNGENAIIETIRKQPVNDMLREFNNNEIHCLLLNQSGATGISAHAVPTKNVPRDQVKQRCMVILQPELDVNTEVQKRGRIYRTGQIKTPIYDYVISAVPAEKRLMMMLQKKLKSLSANTSASQKDADKTIVSDDFLNKYGDRIVQEYLKNSKTINMLLGDPLKLNKEGNKEESEVEDVFPNAAQKASGRVAILSIKDQEDFYDNITGTYQGEIKYLNEIGQNDLVVKDLNFEAETKSREIAIAGQGKLTSVFGRHSILEKCDVNNLRKPLTRKELDKFVSVALGGRDADDISADLIKKYNAYVENRRAIDMSYEEEVYKLKLKNRQEMKDWAALTDDKKRAVQEALREEMEQRKETDNEDWDDRLKRFEKSVRFFTIGQGYAYPFSAGQTSESSFFSKAVFLGFSIDEKKKNPYAPSSVEMKFAIADSRRIVSLPMSKSDVIAMIRGLSDNNRWELRDVYAEWDSLIKDSMALRTTRYIVTGNILQAFGKDEFKAGSLVSYTLKGGGRKKGILLPDSFKPEGSGQRGDEDMKVDVPINQVIDKLILKMEDGSALYFKNGNMLLRDHDKYGGSDSYRFSVPASKQAGGEYYLNKTILSEFISGNDFNKRGSQMEGVIKSDKIERFCLYLWDKYKASVSISRAKFEALFGSDLDMDYSEEDIERNRQVFDMALREAQARRKAELEATAGEQRMKEETERLEKEQKEREGRLTSKLAYQEATGVLLHLQELLLEDAIVAMRNGGRIN